MSDWAFIKNHPESWKGMEPHYFYVQQALVDSMETAKNNWRYHVRLVLESDYPGIFRAGDLEDYPDVSAQDLNCAVAEMIEVEREKAMAAFTLIREHSEAVEEKLMPLRAEALELFERMQEVADDEMLELSTRFDTLTDEEQKIRHAYSLQNPWVLNFIQLGAGLTHETAVAAIDHIKVCAAVIDQDWLSNPIYPSAGRYNKGMSKAIGAEAPWIEIERDKSGRKKRRVKNLIYHEPRLLITDIIPIPRFYQYRDYLPQSWLDPRSEKEKAEAASARKETGKWIQGQQEETHVRSYRKRRKKRN